MSHKKKKMTFLGAAAALLVLPVSLVASKRQEPTAEPSPVERGRYLVSTIGCGDCHTPKKMTPNG